MRIKPILKRLTNLFTITGAAVPDFGAWYDRDIYSNRKTKRTPQP